MRVYGLTGGVGMGKTTAGSILARLGCRIVDTDVIARSLTEPGQPALLEIQRAFGSDCIGADSRLRREVLARRVFSNETDRRRLEAILHPRIRTVWLTELERWRGEGVTDAVVVIPLLFETDAAGELDSTICVACPARLQYQRLQQRGWSVEEIEQRIDAQMPIRKKMDLCNYLVWNCAGLDVLESQLKLILTVRSESHRAVADQ